MQPIYLKTTHAYVKKIQWEERGRYPVQGPKYLWRGLAQGGIPAKGWTKGVSLFHLMSELKPLFPLFSIRIYHLLSLGLAICLC